jgi:hypothetical protein
MPGKAVNVGLSVFCWPAPLAASVWAPGSGLSSICRATVSSSLDASSACSTCTMLCRFNVNVIRSQQLPSCFAASPVLQGPGRTGLVCAERGMTGMASTVWKVSPCRRQSVCSDQASALRVLPRLHKQVLLQWPHHTCIRTLPG